ncbi:MAG: hypothetical protein D6715_10550 [Calditrichaeota bacterium]|nr:MAG: hypothetical protein D6715_10550 [Calditrichota bacterium]
MQKTAWISILLALIGLAFADAVIVEFQAEPSQNRIYITWKTGEENGVQVFVVERSINNKDFTAIGEVAPKGSNSTYEFVDENFSEAKTVFYYRLQIKNTDGSSQFTDSLPVIPTISSLTRTWGSIKALFK